MSPVTSTADVKVETEKWRQVLNSGIDRTAGGDLSREIKTVGNTTTDTLSVPTRSAATKTDFVPHSAKNGTLAKR